MSLPAALVEGFLELSLAAAREAAKQIKTRRRRSKPPRGATLKPGPQTPLWNHLRELIIFHTARRGEKAKLARELGVPRQRIYEYLRAGSTMPDAEKTLFLICWASAKATHQDPPR